MATSIEHVLDELGFTFAGDTCDLSLRDLARVARCQSSLAIISRSLRELILKTRDGIERVITFANCNILMDIMPEAYKTADYQCKLLTLMVARFNRTFGTRLERLWNYLSRVCDNVQLHTPAGHDVDARLLAHAQFDTFKRALQSVFDETYHHGGSVLRNDCLQSMRVWLCGPDILIPGAASKFPENLKTCKHFVLQTVLGFACDPNPTSNAAKFIRHIDFNLRADPAFVLQLLRAGVYVPLVHRLRGDREFIMQAVLLNHRVVFEMSPDFATDLDLAIRATEQHWESVRAFDASVVSNTRVLVAAVTSFAKSQTTEIRWARRDPDATVRVATAWELKPSNIQGTSLSNAMESMHSYVAKDDNFLSLLASSLNRDAGNDKKLFQKLLQKALGWLSTWDCINSKRSALQVLRWKWSYLEYVSMGLRSDEAFMMQCIAIDVHAAKLGANILRRQKSYWQHAAGVRFEVVALYINKQSSLRHLRNDVDIMAAAHNNKQKRARLATKKAVDTKQVRKANKSLQ